MGAFLDGDWESLCKLFTVDESPHLSSNFLEYSSSPISFQDDNLKFPFLSHNVNDNNLSYSSSLNDWMSSNPTNSYNCGTDSLLSSDILSCIDFSMVNSDNDALSLPPSTNNIVHNHNPNHDHNHNNNHDHNNFGSVDKLSSPNTELCLKRKLDESDELMEETTKKNAQISKDAMKKRRKVNQKADEETTPTVNTKESKETADSNSDDTNNLCGSEENAETADSNSNLAVSLSSTVKKRANRGAATDPQSLYARKRRMRINERLKVLQNLVPNGTKVDISTMLEEAFHYVKFLQLQIRLLSSDDLWMYAPLAYNGFDVGAYRKMPPFHGL